MKKTFKELNEVDSLVGELYKKYPTLRETKFGYAYKRFADKNVIPLVTEFNERLNDIRVDNALEDEKTKEVLIDRLNSRGYKFSKDGLKKAINQERELEEEFNKKEVEIEPFISSFVPELNEEQTEQLSGLII